MNDKFLAQRILVIGSSGAGKSSLSTALGKILGIDVIHLDRHFYQPGWKSLPPARWREVVARLVATDRWIMDGDFSDTFDPRFPVRMQ
jgi:adenylate kinase family enzyme